MRRSSGKGGSCTKSKSLLEEWIEKADEDLVVAKKALNGRKKVLWATCFHSQQSTEKYLKGYLVFRGTVPRKTHDLIELLQQCIAKDPSFELLRDLCDSLQPYSVEIRYPTESGLTLIDAKNAFRAAVEIKKFVQSKLLLRKR